MEDYVYLLSKLAFFIIHKHGTYTMRTLKWDPLFDPEKETTTTIAWIFFPYFYSIVLAKRQSFPYPRL